MSLAATRVRPLRAHGITVAVPPGWDARIEQRRDDPILAPPAWRLDGEQYPRSGTPNPVVHLANFALPRSRGDYGTGAVEQMRARHVFVALVEFDPEAAATPAFARSRMPTLGAADFHPDAQQRIVAGHCGAQRFFHTQGRAFSLFVVLGSWALRRAAVGTVNRALAGVAIGSRPA